MSENNEIKRGNWILIIVLLLTSVSLLAATILTLHFDNPTFQQTALIETCSTTWKMGFGAILGLLSGKNVMIG